MADTDQTRQQQREDMMLRGSLPRVITKMALPSIISFLITSIYNLADTYFVSDLGESAQAAISVNASLDQIIMMAGSMLAVGAASYISRLLGAKEKDKANQVLSTAFFTAMIFGGIVTLLGVTFLHPMVRLLGATDTCEQFAVEYATYVLLVAPFMAANFVMNQCLRAEGSALLSMVVKGASLATAISKLVSFAILVFPYLTRRSVLHLTIRKFRPTRDIVTQVVTVGSSSMFRSGLAVVSAIVLNNIAGQISDAVLAGVGVSTKVMMFPFGVILGFGTGFQPVAGFNWGARRYDRVKESYRFASRAAILGALAMGLTLAALADPLIGLFAKSDQSAEMLAVGALCIRLQCLALPIHGWVAVVNMFCAGLGNARGALLLSTSRQGTCFLPIVYPMAWLWGTNGVAAVQAVADVLTLLLAVPLIRRVKARIQAAADAQAIEGSALSGGETP